MAYILNKTTGEVLITLLDGTADGPDINPGLNVTDLDLFGKNYPFYGEFMDENFIKLLQNFANITAPSSPLEGELWYDISDSTNHVLRIFNNTSWVPVTPVWVSTTAPVTTQVGAQWWDSTNFQLNMYNGTGWTVVGPAYRAPDGKSGGIVENVYDTDGNLHTIIKFYTNNNVVAVVSYDQAFTLNDSNPITGFSVISPGFTLSTEANNLIHGTAVNAQQLGNIAAANYARNDIDSSFYGNVNVGGNSLVIASLVGGTGRFINTINNGNISLYANVSGVSTRVLSVNGTTGEVTVSQSPANSMALTTKNYVDTSISVATTPLAPINSAALTGIPTAPNVVLANTNTAQIATMNSVQNAIANGNTAPWLGSQKTVSTSLPVDGSGNPGDFWFQI